MKVKKIIKKIKKFSKNLTRSFLGKKNKKCRDAAPQAQVIKPLPFVSVFASVRIQKEKKSAFLVAGNDVSKINFNSCTPMCPKPETMSMNASVEIEVKNQNFAAN